MILKGKSRIQKNVLGGNRPRNLLCHWRVFAHRATPSYLHRIINLNTNWNKIFSNNAARDAIWEGLDEYIMKVWRSRLTKVVDFKRHWRAEYYRILVRRLNPIWEGISQLNWLWLRQIVVDYRFSTSTVKACGCDGSIIPCNTLISCLTHICTEILSWCLQFGPNQVTSQDKIAMLVPTTAVNK